MGTYLGCPLDVDGRSLKLFDFIHEKIMNKITSWKFQLLSQAGRLILINSILIAMHGLPYFVSFPGAEEDKQKD